MRKILILFTVTITLAGSLSLYTNPFTQQPSQNNSQNDNRENNPQAGQDNETPDNVETENSGGLFTGLWQWFVKVQKNFNDSLSESILKIKKNFSFLTVLFIIGISIIYGVLHAVGPGHGKLLISSYIIKEKINLKDSILFSVIVVFSHMASSLLVAGILRIFFPYRQIEAQAQSRNIFILVSGIAIFLIGVYMLIHLIRSRKNNDTSNKGMEKIKNIKGLKKKTKLYLIGLLAGIIPCPVSLMVIILGFTYGAFIVAVISVIGISIGTGITIFVICILTVKFKDVVLKISDKKKSFGAKVYTFFEYSGSALIIFFGIILFLSSLT